MKHATPVALDALEHVLQQIRGLDGLTEKKRGVFYRRSSAFLHFHEDPAGFFADLKTGPLWERLPANSPAERRALVARIKQCFDCGLIRKRPASAAPSASTSGNRWRPRT